MSKISSLKELMRFPMNILDEFKELDQGGLTEDQKRRYYLKNFRGTSYQTFESKPKFKLSRSSIEFSRIYLEGSQSLILYYDSVAIAAISYLLVGEDRKIFTGGVERFEQTKVHEAYIIQIQGTTLMRNTIDQLDNNDFLKGFNWSGLLIKALEYLLIYNYENLKIINVIPYTESDWRGRIKEGDRKYDQSAKILGYKLVKEKKGNSSFRVIHHAKNYEQEQIFRSLYTKTVRD